MGKCFSALGEREKKVKFTYLHKARTFTFAAATISPSKAY